MILEEAILQQDVFERTQKDCILSCTFADKDIGRFRIEN